LRQKRHAPYFSSHKLHRGVPWSGSQTSLGTRSRAKQTPPCHNMWPRCHSFSQYLPVIKPQSTHGLNSNFSSPTAATTSDMKESNHAKLCHVLPQRYARRCATGLEPMCRRAHLLRCHRPSHSSPAPLPCNDHIFPERAAEHAFCVQERRRWQSMAVDIDIRLTIR